MYFGLVNLGNFQVSRALFWFLSQVVASFISANQKPTFLGSFNFCFIKFALLSHDAPFSVKNLLRGEPIVSAVPCFVLSFVDWRSKTSLVQSRMPGSDCRVSLSWLGSQRNKQRISGQVRDNISESDIKWYLYHIHVIRDNHSIVFLNVVNKYFFQGPEKTLTKSILFNLLLVNSWNFINRALMNYTEAKSWCIQFSNQP